MKRNFSRVSKDHVRRLKKWLKAEDKLHCPFNGNSYTCLEDVCYDIFPFLVKGGCPCVQSGERYAVQVARLVIRKCQQ